MDDVYHFGALDSSGNYVPASLATKDTKYSCPDCKEPVTHTKAHTRSHTKDGVKTRINIRAFFSHLPNSDCSVYSNPGESHFHKEAKRLISYYIDKCLITFTRKCMTCKEDDIIYTTSLTHTAKEEYMYDRPTTTNTADVALFDGPNMKLIVEIYHTHRTEEWKRPDPWVELGSRVVLHKLGTGEDVRLSCMRLCKHMCLACKLEKERIEKEAVEMKKRLEEEAVERKKKQEAEAVERKKKQEAEAVEYKKKLEREAAKRKKDADDLALYYKQTEETKLYKAKQELLDSQERLRLRNETWIEPPIVSQFNASMTEKEKIVHALAAKMLETRYNPVQCNLFRSFSAKQKSTDAKQKSTDAKQSSASKP